MNELVRATTLIGNTPLVGAYTLQNVIQTMAEMRLRRASMIESNVGTCIARLEKAFALKDQAATGIDGMRS